MVSKNIQWVKGDVASATSPPVDVEEISFLPEGNETSTEDTEDTEDTENTQKDVVESGVIPTPETEVQLSELTESAKSIDEVGNESLENTEEKTDLTNPLSFFELGKVYKFGKRRDCLVIGKNAEAIVVQGVNSKKQSTINISELEKYIEANKGDK